MVECKIDCDANIIIGCDRLRSHDFKLVFLRAESTIRTRSLCRAVGCVPVSHYRLSPAACDLRQPLDAVHVRAVLAALRHQQLYAKICKCRLGWPSIGFLGNII